MDQEFGLWEFCKSIFRVLNGDLDSAPQEPKDMTVEEQEAIDQIKEVIATTLPKLPGNTNSCTIKVTWNLHEADTECEYWMRPDVEITYTTADASHIHI